MNLYLLWQDANNDYDTYDSCIVCAEDMTEAIKIHPANNPGDYRENYWFCDRTWAAPEDIYCKLIGKADPSIPKGLVLASFNAG